MPEGPHRISAWEWFAGAVATAIVGAMIVSLLVTGRSEQTPPRFAIDVQSIDTSGADFVVRFSIRNDGRQTAAEVMVEGQLQGGGDPPETSVVTFDYVPGNSVRRGGVLFRRDPRAAKLTLRALGYRQP